MRYIRCLLIEKKGEHLKTVFKDKSYWDSVLWDVEYYYDDNYVGHEDYWSVDANYFNLIEHFNEQYNEQKKREVQKSQLYPSKSTNR